jgi:hypothetical protein
MSRILAVLLLAATLPALADDRHENVRTIEPRLPAGGIVVENLLGSITVRGGAARGKVRIEARTVAEADGIEAARALAESVDLEATAGQELTVRVALPVDRYPALRLPRSERDGLMDKWIAPIVRRKSTAATWQGRTVEVGNVRGAPAIAVHLEVTLPLDTRATFRQVLGTVHAIGVRGPVTLDVTDGVALAQQVYGSLDVRTGSSHLDVRKFQVD